MPDLVAVISHHARGALVAALLVLAAVASAQPFASDGFHPASTGYELWADAMWPDVERAVVAPRVQARRPAAAER